MTPRFLTVCEVFQPAEKACWEILLRERARVSHVPSEILTGTIERTLTQLWSMLGARSVEAWMRETPAEPLPGWLPKDCGLEELLAYFCAGQRAVELMLVEIEHEFPNDTPERRTQRRVELRLAFNVLVQRGLDAMCGACAKYPTCSLSGRRPSGAGPEAPPEGKRRVADNARKRAG